MARVLVVDDEPRITEFVQRGLAIFGVAVETSTDGRRALDLLLAGGFDLVLVDLMMPGMDGIALLRRILAADPDQRVMVVSAISDVRSKVRCLEFGAVDYLAKPFDLEELAARINAHVRSRRRSAGTVRHAGGLTLDVERRSADTGGGPVALTAREFDLLLTLMERPGCSWRRDELLHRVWGDGDVDANVLEACVRRLRAKLGLSAVETVRNVGYRLVVA